MVDLLIILFQAFLRRRWSFGATEEELNSAFCHPDPVHLLKLKPTKSCLKDPENPNETNPNKYVLYEDVLEHWTSTYVISI